MEKKIAGLQNLIVRLLKRLRLFWYMYCYDVLTLDADKVLFDSRNGKDLGSNLLCLAKEMVSDSAYQKYKLYFSCNSDKKVLFSRMLKQLGVRKVVLIREAGFSHYRLLAKAKYLFTDTSLPHEFMKKKGQVLINTWHGTPLKKMGRDEKGQAYAMGNVQKGQLYADYLIYPSRYMMGIMMKAYCMENLYKGKILFSGYPRNSLFFKPKEGQRLKILLGYEKNRIYVYMPTWRGSLEKLQNEAQIVWTELCLTQLDKRLEANEICFVKFHPFVSGKIRWDDYCHILPFPGGYDTYEIINMAECLITDYSSVFFDFANTGRKIILFIYDYDMYCKDRGLYLGMEELPFPTVDSVEELVKELRIPVNYDDSKFRSVYCTYDHPDAARDILRHILIGEKIMKEESVIGNGKGNILIYPGETKTELDRNSWICFEEKLKGKNVFAVLVSPKAKTEPKSMLMIPPTIGILMITEIRKSIRHRDREFKRQLGYGTYEKIIICKGYNDCAESMFLHAGVPVELIQIGDTSYAKEKSV